LHCAKFWNYKAGIFRLFGLSILQQNVIWTVVDGDELFIFHWVIVDFGRQLCYYHSAYMQASWLCTIILAFATILYTVWAA
jgi:hypothetical protein